MGSLGGGRKWRKSGAIFVGFFRTEMGGGVGASLGLLLSLKKKGVYPCHSSSSSFCKVKFRVIFFSSFVDFVSPEKKGVKNWGLISEKRYNAFSRFFFGRGV